jgi:hypothetical protein
MAKIRETAYFAKDTMMDLDKDEACNLVRFANLAHICGYVGLSGNRKSSHNCTTSEGKQYHAIVLALFGAFVRIYTSTTPSSTWHLPSDLSSVACMRVVGYLNIQYT